MKYKILTFTFKLQFIIIFYFKKTARKRFLLRPMPRSPPYLREFLTNYWPTRRGCTHLSTLTSFPEINTAEDLSVGPFSPLLDSLLK
jgi:hypothetical protein